MNADRQPKAPVAGELVDERDMVYALRKRAVELHTRAARIEARAWELNRAIQLRKAGR